MMNREHIKKSWVAEHTSALIGACGLIVAALITGIFVFVSQNNISPVKNVPMEAKADKENVKPRSDAPNNGASSTNAAQSVETKPILTQNAGKEEKKKVLTSSKPPEIPSIHQIDKVKSNNFRSCKDIFENGQDERDGIFEIDADGPEGKLEPFDVFCNMNQEGGGWLLYANHSDGIGSIRANDIVTLDKPGVMKKEIWNVVLRNMKVGMMFIDEHGHVATISANKLQNGNCNSTFTPGDLSNPIRKSGAIWHNENSGCDVRGLDYSLIQLQGREYKHYKKAGAAIYESSSVKFDDWPYPKEYSYENQNSLLYFVK